MVVTVLKRSFGEGISAMFVLYWLSFRSVYFRDLFHLRFPIYQREGSITPPRGRQPGKISCLLVHVTTPTPSTFCTVLTSSRNLLYIAEYQDTDSCTLEPLLQTRFNAHFQDPTIDRTQCLWISFMRKG